MLPGRDIRMQTAMAFAMRPGADVRPSATAEAVSNRKPAAGTWMQMEMGSATAAARTARRERLKPAAAAIMDAVGAEAADKGKLLRLIVQQMMSALPKK